MGSVWDTLKGEGKEVLRERNKRSARRCGRIWVLALVTLALLVAGASPTLASPPPESQPFEVVALPAEVASWSPGVAALEAARRSRSHKLDSSLAELEIAVTEQGTTLAGDLPGLRLQGDRVQVQVVTSESSLAGALAAISAVGGQVTGVGNDRTLIQGWLPVTSLTTVAASDDVYRVRRPAMAVPLESIQAGSAATEGIEAINADAWHTFGHLGQGVKVGIIDGGFEGYSDLLGSDLPASVVVRNFVDGETDEDLDGTTPHGTACAEIIHDVAPGAALHLAKIGTNLDLQEAVEWLKDTHQVDIISTSLGWYNLTPGDGTGEFADLVRETRDAGILWVTAAGNDRESHWGGAYVDDGYDYHTFAADQNVNYFGPGNGNAYLIPAGYLVQVYLRWDDWTQVDQDYDLYLLRFNDTTQDWEEVDYSVNEQDGSPGQTPTEAVWGYTSGDAAPYGFVIARWDSNRNVNLEVFAPNMPRLDELVHARSLANLADAPDAVTVAALDVSAPYPQEVYSSEGPTNGPGGTASGGFAKPEIAGFANVATVSYGTSSRFNGTSSATPHVAGAAALALSARPSASPAWLQTFLSSRAVDMGPTGMDTMFGHGRLYLGLPLGTDPSAFLPLILR